MPKIKKTKLVSGKVTEQEKDAFTEYCDSIGETESSIIRKHVKHCIRLGAKRVPLNQYKPDTKRVFQ